MLPRSRSDGRDGMYNVVATGRLEEILPLTVHALLLFRSKDWPSLLACLLACYVCRATCPLATVDRI